MKKLILFIIAIFYCFQSNAQSNEDTLEWAPVGAKWWFSKEWCGFFPDCGYYTFESVKDTFIAGINAKLMEVERFNGGYSFPDYFIMYGDSDRVYHYDTINNEFYVLYDFSLNTGDTLTIQDTIYRGYDFSINNREIPLFQVIVDSVTIKQINGKNLRVLHTSPVSKSSYEFWEPVIEHIGCQLKLFGIETILLTAGWYGGFRCYSDSKLYFHPYPHPCDYVVTVSTEKNLIKNNGVKVFPNPANDIINVKLPENTVLLNVEIYNIMGALVKSNPKNLNIPIDISDLKNGMYIVRILTNDANISQNFIKY